MNEFFNWMSSIGIDKEKIILLDHHKAHAWSAFSCSPFDDAIILTADGRGDFKSTTISEGDIRKGIKELDFLTSFLNSFLIFNQHLSCLILLFLFYQNQLL